MEIAELLVIMGVPTAITGLLIWWLKRSIDKKEAKRDEQQKNTETLVLLLVQTSRATNVLAEATAKAVQRIPDAKCNGDMTAALEQAAKIHDKEKDFIEGQGIKHIFED